LSVGELAVAQLNTPQECERGVAKMERALAGFGVEPQRLPPSLPEELRTGAKVAQSFVSSSERRACRHGSPRR
jgi:hypothetical protein